METCHAHQYLRFMGGMLDDAYGQIVTTVFSERDADIYFLERRGFVRRINIGLYFILRYIMRYYARRWEFHTGKADIFFRDESHCHAFFHILEKIDARKAIIYIHIYIVAGSGGSYITSAAFSYVTPLSILRGYLQAYWSRVAVAVAAESCFSQSCFMPPRRRYQASWHIYFHSLYVFFLEILFTERDTHELRYFLKA